MSSEKIREAEKSCGIRRGGGWFPWILLLTLGVLVVLLVTVLVIILLNEDCVKGSDVLTSDKQLITVSTTDKSPSQEQNKPFVINKYEVVATINEMTDVPGEVECSSDMCALEGDLQKANRHKRKATSSLNVRKWPKKIKYNMDQFEKKEQSAIINALDEWQSKTCLQFIRQSDQPPKHEKYVHFQKTDGGRCRAVVGVLADEKAHLVKLDPQVCFNWHGDLLHEVGHVLGLVHEHTRTDRDQFVNVIRQNVKENSQKEFDVTESTLDDVTQQVPYDLASVMHYSTKAFLRDELESTDKVTIQTNDPDNQNVIGQRVELSFYDVQAVNLIYCQEECGSTSLICENGGYQDPTDCGRCLCPDGFGGDDCTHVIAGDPACSPHQSVLELSPDHDHICVSSPGYSNQRPYDWKSQCNWMIQVPDGCDVESYFEGEFGVLNDTDGQCQHWVEVNTAGVKPNTAVRGRRFCGSRRPQDRMTIAGQQVLVTFRSHSPRSTTQQDLHHTFHQKWSKGFNLCFSLKQSETCRPTPPKVMPRGKPIPTSTTSPSAKSTSSSTRSKLTTTSAGAAYHVRHGGGDGDGGDEGTPVVLIAGVTTGVVVVTLMILITLLLVVRFKRHSRRSSERSSSLDHIITRDKCDSLPDSLSSSPSSIRAILPERSSRRAMRSERDFERAMYSGRVPVYPVWPAGKVGFTDPWLGSSSVEHSPASSHRQFIPVHHVHSNRKHTSPMY